MVDFGINTGVRDIADSILTVTAKAIDAEWFAEDITTKLSSAAVIAPIVVDFSISSMSSACNERAKASAAFLHLDQ